MKTIDCRGLVCPQPVITTKKYFDSIDEGTAVVLVDNEVACNNVAKLLQNSGYQYSIEENGAEFQIRVQKGLAEKEPDPKAGVTVESFALVISSDMLGRGEDELGRRLMITYLYALGENDKIPDEIILMNSGVLLATEGTDCLGSLKKLEEMGAHISCCGTCLDYYGLKDKLVIGDITNMYDVVDIMNGSTKTIVI